MKIRELAPLLEEKKSLYITLILSVIYILPLLLANYNYLDDLGRNHAGYGWQHDGRFIATLLGKTWSLNNLVFSIFPFSILVSAVVLGFTGFLITKILGIENDKKVKWSSLLIITAPTFLGNLVFKFDILPMSIALLLITIPFLFYQNKLNFFMVSVVAIFLSLGLYQNGTTVYFMIGSVFLIDNIRRFEVKKFLKNFSIIIISFLIGLCLYLLTLKLSGIELYMRGELIALAPGFFEELVNNNEVFFDRLDFILSSGHYNKLISVFLLLAFAGFIYSVISKSKILPSVFAAILIFGILLINFWLIAGVNIFLKGSYWDLRSFCGLGFFLIIAAKFQDSLKGYFYKLSRISMIVLIFFSFVLISQFGRLLTNQNEYQNAVSSLLMNHFKDESITKIAFVGTLPLAPNNKLVYRTFPLFHNLLSSPIGKYSFWTKEALNTNGMMKGISIIEVADVDCKYDVVEKTKWYYIRKIDHETLIIDFNKNVCN